MKLVGRVVIMIPQQSEKFGRSAAKNAMLGIAQGLIIGDAFKFPPYRRSPRSEMNYVEAIVTSAGSADLPRIQSWFEKQGFQVVPMKMGLLVTGGEDLFRRVFEVDDNE